MCSEEARFRVEIHREIPGAFARVGAPGTVYNANTK